MTTDYENVTESSSDVVNTLSWTVFWLSVVICLLMGMLSTFGNGLVIYISNKKEDLGGFREINWVVKNLAISDFLFGVVGCPLTIVFWCWGRLPL